MYCRECDFHSFDYLNTCPQCGKSWEAARKTLGMEGMEQPRGNWFAEICPEEGNSPQPAPSARLVDRGSHVLMVEIKESRQPAEEGQSVRIEPGEQEEP